MSTPDIKPDAVEREYSYMILRAQQASDDKKVNELRASLTRYRAEFKNYERPQTDADSPMMKEESFVQ